MGVAGLIFKQIATTFSQGHSSKLRWALPPTWLRFLIIVVLVLGVFFRFVNLDHKVYWLDETYTSFRVSGYTEPEIVQELSERKIFSVEDIQKYQRINSEKSVVDTVKGLATEEPQLTPLYFVMARYWAKLFGDGTGAMRSFPAFTSLLVFPLVYWLCLELFESSLVGWIAIALIAVSPFHLVFAQEARPYALWAVMILLSSASLLRAMRIKTKGSWGIYSATVALGLYCFLFFALVAISHGIYVFLIEGLRRTKALKAYLLATATGFLAFLPWIIVVTTYFSQINRATAQISLTPRKSLLFIAKNWVGNLSRNLFDLGLETEHIQSFQLPVFVTLVSLILALFLLAVYSLYYLYRQTPPRVWLFVISLCGVTALALILADLILGGNRSIVARYFVPCHLGVQLAVAYLFSRKISYAPFNLRQQKLWQPALVAVLSVGIVSATVYSQADTWWHKKTNSYNPQLAPLVNQATSPLVVKEMVRNAPPYDFFKLVSLSYWVEPQVKFQPIFKNSLPTISEDFSDIFIVAPSQELLARLKRKPNIQLQPLEEVTETVVVKLVQQ